jgi:hypothetical protein
MRHSAKLAEQSQSENRSDFNARSDAWQRARLQRRSGVRIRATDKEKSASDRLQRLLDGKNGKTRFPADHL